MAANLDKSENSLTSVSTLTYLRGIDASGNSVKISTSDLASVLGVPVSGNVGTTDLNTFISNGVYHSSDRNPTNGPSGAGYGLLCVFRGPGNHTAQRYIDIENGNKSYQRSCVDLVGSTWSDWILEYDHNLLSNSTELRSLANALGGNRWSLFAQNNGKYIKLFTFTSSVGGCVIDCQYAHPTNNSWSVSRYLIDRYSNQITVRRLNLYSNMSTEIDFIGISGNDVYFSAVIDRNCLAMPIFLDYLGCNIVMTFHDSLPDEITKY